MTEFSLPTPEKPVPAATVKVFFYIPDLTDPNERKIQFRFENDSLIHQFEKTIRITQMEVDLNNQMLEMVRINLTA